jgi:hypothetical protein
MMIIARRTRIDPVRAAPHDLLQPSALLVGQPPRPHRLSHHVSRHSVSSS